MHGLEKEYQGRIEFVRVNILRPESVAMIEEYNFSTTPEFYLVDEQGQILAFWSDTTPAEELRKAFDDALY